MGDRVELWKERWRGMCNSTPASLLPPKLFLLFPLSGCMGARNKMAAKNLEKLLHTVRVLLSQSTQALHITQLPQLLPLPEGVIYPLACLFVQQQHEHVHVREKEKLKQPNNHRASKHKRRKTQHIPRHVLCGAHASADMSMPDLVAARVVSRCEEKTKKEPPPQKKTKKKTSKQTMQPINVSSCLLATSSSRQQHAEGRQQWHNAPGQQPPIVQTGLRSAEWLKGES